MQWSPAQIKLSSILFHQSIIKPRSCKNQLAKNGETATDKESPWAQVSPFVTLVSEREEVFQLKCFLNTIT